MSEKRNITNTVEETVNTLNQINTVNIANKPTTTKHLLTSNNYRLWLTDMDLLLVINDVDDYVYEEKVKVIKKNKIAKENLKKYKKVRGCDDLYYEKDVTKEMIKLDSLAKHLINNSISDEIKIKLDFQRSSAYQIWNILKASNTRSNEERKLELKNKLENMKYNKENDISLFIEEMNNIFNELSSLEMEISDEKKFEYLYLALPYEITLEVNIMDHDGKWEDVTKCLKKKVPKLKYLKELRKENNHKNNTVINVNSMTKKNRFTPRNNRGRKRCYICNKLGHIARDCWHNEKNKRKKNNNIKANNASINKEDGYCEFADAQISLEDYNSDEDIQSSYSVRPRRGRY